MKFAVSLRNETPTEPAEIRIYETIGQDPWTGEGMGAEDFAKILDSIPKNRELSLKINSRGGDVWDGMTIKNTLRDWPAGFKAEITGIAASTASWFMLDAKEVSISPDAQVFIHDAWGICMGNAADMKGASVDLDKTSDQIAEMYSRKNGRSKSEMRRMMRDNSLLTGTEAVALGLCDKLTNEKAVYNFTPGELDKMKSKLAALNSVRTSASDAGNDNTTKIMDKTKIIALLNKHGVKDIAGVALDKATDEQLESALNKLMEPKPNEGDGEGDGDKSELASLRNEMNQLKEINNAAKKTRITTEVQNAINEDKIPAAQLDSWVKRAMQDDTVLLDLAALPSRAPGSSPVSSSVDVVSDSFEDIQKFVVENGPKLTRNFVGGRTGGELGQSVMRDIQNRAIKIANVIAKNREKIIGMFNTNTIDADLQRTVILSDMLRAFSIKLLPLGAFCKTFSNVPLEGTDKVTVPFFPLQTASATDFVAGTGYTTLANTTENARTVTVNKRKYVGMTFSSSELRRQPYQNWQQLAQMNAERLGVLVNADVLSVVTAANYGAAVKILPAAAFTGDDVADLYGSATDLNWPDVGRSLVLTTGYKVALLKDPGFKYALNYGTDDAIRRAQIQSAYGFQDIYTVPTANLPTNSENLRGFINHMSAALVATAPIMPAPAVRALMVQYDMVVDPMTGIAIEYRLFGNATTDQTNEIVECNYGYAVGVAAALARITSA